MQGWEAMNQGLNSNPVFTPKLGNLVRFNQKELGLGKGGLIGFWESHQCGNPGSMKTLKLAQMIRKEIWL